MFISELLLNEMAPNEYRICADKIKQEFRNSGVDLVLTTHVADQVAYKPDRADMVSPEIFMETMRAILTAFNNRKLGKYIYMASKKPESHALFKHKFQTPDGGSGTANTPCAIAKLKGTTPFKFTIITFMVKDNYQNDNFPQDSVMWI